MCNNTYMCVVVFPVYGVSTFDKDELFGFVN